MRNAEFGATSSSVIAVSTFIEIRVYVRHTVSEVAIPQGQSVCKSEPGVGLRGSTVATESGYIYWLKCGYRQWPKCGYRQWLNCGYR
jgi:hypothetical protein